MSLGYRPILLTISCHRRMEQLGGGRLGRSEVGRNIDAGEEIAHMVTKIVMLRSEIANLLASLIL